MLYAIGDLHLSTSVPKKMDVFGGNWKNYEKKIEKNLSALCEYDTIILCGDTSWGKNLQESLDDFLFLQKCKAKKIILKGNHDYFWDTANKMKKFWEQHNISCIDILHNNAFLHEKLAICGTRGWFVDEKNDNKLIKREAGRLKASLAEGRKLTDGELLVFLHYPPLYENFACDPILEVLQEFGVKRCFYGHLHGYGIPRGVNGVVNKIEYKLISADALNFEPIVIDS